MKFKLLNGAGAQSPVDISCSEIYLRNLGAAIEGIENFPGDRDILKRFVFYGVKYITTERKLKHTPKQVLDLIKMIHHINARIGKLTPLELMHIFPVDKRYNGAKDETKDYFHTMDFLKGIGLRAPIGEVDDVMELLWEYVNEDIGSYCITIFSLIDEANAYEGKSSIVQTILEGQEVPAYTKLSEGSKAFLRDNSTEKIRKIGRARPKYLRLV